jgi:pimeloyl-ACP methyl ester carboxylesterase
MMRFIKIVVLSCIFLLVTISCTAWSEEVVGTEMVKLKTADGISLTGVLHQRHPSLNRAGVVMVHGYSGNFYSGIMGFLPKALADLGYTTLAINMRDHDRTPKKNLFEENRLDIAAAVDEMAGRGIKPLFLYGHSMGTNRVLYYLAETQDPRIYGALLTGPPGNLFAWNVKMFGKETATQVLRQAQDLVASGKGDQWMLINLGPLGKALYTANHLVSLRGPKTVSDPFNNIARISKPIIVVHGLSDRLAEHTVADKLYSSAAKGNKVSVVKLAGAGHSFYNRQKDLVDTINRWLKEQMQQ